MGIVPPTLLFTTTAHHIVNTAIVQPSCPPKVPTICQVGFKFKKRISTYGTFVETSVKIRKQAKANKIYRIGYSDRDEEGITRKTLEVLVASLPNF